MTVRPDNVIQAPAEVIAALKQGHTGTNGWTRSHCPYCDPEATRQPTLVAHPRHGFKAGGTAGGWKCHRESCPGLNARNGTSMGELALEYDADAAAEHADRKRQRVLDMTNRSTVLQANDPAERYLKSRKLRRPQNGWPPTLRLGWLAHPEDVRAAKREGRTAYDVPRHPTLIAVVTDRNDQQTAVHRTYLTNDGRKAPFQEVRLALGPVRSNGVRLGEIGDDGRVVLVEGIEDALAAGQLWPQFGTPIACLSAGGLRHIELPPGATEITIVADNDPSQNGQRFGAGEAAGRAAQDRFLKEKRDVRLFVPELEKDANAMLQAASTEDGL